MTDTNLARFTINATVSETAAGVRGYNADPDETLSCKLEASPPAGVLSVTFSVYDPDDPTSPLASRQATLQYWDSNSEHAITLAAVSDTEDLTVDAATDFDCFIIRCSAVTAQGVHVYERMVAIRKSTIRTVIPGETQQWSLRGWADALDEALEWMAGGGSDLNPPADPGDDGKVAVADSGDLTYIFITNEQIADGADIEVDKLDATGVTDGWVLTASSEVPTWAAPGGGLTPPADPGDDDKVAVASGGDLTYIFIGADQISDGSITVDKLDATGITDGWVITASGGDAVWAANPVSLTAPGDPGDDLQVAFASSGDLAYTDGITVQDDIATEDALAFGSGPAQSGTLRLSPSSAIRYRYNSTDCAVCAWESNSLVIGEGVQSTASTIIRNKTGFILLRYDGESGAPYYQFAYSSLTLPKNNASHGILVGTRDANGDGTTIAFSAGSPYDSGSATRDGGGFTFTSKGGINGGDGGGFTVNLGAHHGGGALAKFQVITPGRTIPTFAVYETDNGIYVYANDSASFAGSFKPYQIELYDDGTYGQVGIVITAAASATDAAQLYIRGQQAGAGAADPKGGDVLIASGQPDGDNRPGMMLLRTGPTFGNAAERGTLWGFEPADNAAPSGFRRYRTVKYHHYSSSSTGSQVAWTLDTADLLPKEYDAAPDVSIVTHLKLTVLSFNGTGNSYTGSYWKHFTVKVEDDGTVTRWNGNEELTNPYSHGCNLTAPVTITVNGSYLEFNISPEVSSATDFVLVLDVDGYYAPAA